MVNKKKTAPPPAAAEDTETAIIKAIAQGIEHGTRAAVALALGLWRRDAMVMDALSDMGGGVCEGPAYCHLAQGQPCGQCWCTRVQEITDSGLQVMVDEKECGVDFQEQEDLFQQARDTVTDEVFDLCVGDKTLELLAWRTDSDDVDTWPTTIMIYARVIAAVRDDDHLTWQNVFNGKTIAHSEMLRRYTVAIDLAWNALSTPPPPLPTPAATAESG